MKGKAVLVKEDEEPARAEVVDLAERLRQSLKIAGAAGKAKRAKPRAANARRNAASRTPRKPAA